MFYICTCYLNHLKTQRDILKMISCMSHNEIKRRYPTESRHFLVCYINLLQSRRDYCRLRVLLQIGDREASSSLSQPTKIKQFTKENKSITKKKMFPRLVRN
jgi:hypothetical protein